MAEGQLEGATQGREALLRLFDAGSFVELDRLREDAGSTAGYGTVDGAAVYAFAQERTAGQGAVTRAMAAKLTRIYTLAAENGAPVVGVFDSGGARVGDGADAMDGIARVLQSAQAVSGVVPQIAVIAGACVGSGALIAASADIVIAAGDADYYLTPDAPGEADVAAENAADALELARLALSLLPSNNLVSPAEYEPGEPAGGGDWAGCFDEGTALRFGNGGLLGRMGGRVVGGVALTAGEDGVVRETARAARLARLCDAFAIPVVTFADGERFGSLREGALAAQTWAALTVPTVAVVTGRAVGPVYIAAVGAADMALAWEGAVIAPLTPAAAVQVLWRDKLAAMDDPAAERPALEADYAATLGGAEAAAAGGFITDVIPPAETRARVLGLLEATAGKRVSRLPRKHANIRL